MTPDHFEKFLYLISRSKLRMDPEVFSAPNALLDTNIRTLKVSYLYVELGN